MKYAPAIKVSGAAAIQSRSSRMPIAVFPTID
jgi:hypothetical protein